MDVLTAERSSFLYGDPNRNIVGCQANDIDLEMADRLFDDMLDFAKYAFNRSHAAAYATIAYITGWLKYHYPTEFYISALEFTDVSKYPELIAEAKNFGVIVHGPDIERSRKGFSGKNHEIYFGFSGIKGIGDSIKDQQIFCPSFSDFMLKTELSKKAIETLILCGAFDRKVKNRQALLESLTDYYDQKDIIKKQSGELALCEAMIQDLENGIPIDRKKYSITTKNLPDLKKLRAKLETIREKIQIASDEIMQMVIPCEQVLNDVEKNLAYEKELIGMYTSGHPLDPYGTPEDHGCISIQDLEEPESSYDYDCLFGKVVNLRKTVTKKNREEMCFFQIMDQTGVIDACCFPQSYSLCGDQIHEGDVMKFRGQKKAKRNQEEEESFQFILVSKPNAAERVLDKKGQIFLAIEGIDVWELVKMELMRYVAVSGHPLLVYDESTACTYYTGLRISDALMQNPRFKAKICD